MPGTPSQNGVVERHLYVWGCPAEARPYKPNEKKLDSRIVSCYFVGYSKEIEDTPEIPPTQVEEPVQVHEEVTQQFQEPQVQVPLRRSTRERRSTISDDYVAYLQEHEFDMGLEDDPISVSQVKQSSESEKWIEVMKDEMKSMKDNGV
ncbi:hypothetical protein AAG906_004851 [Vitis piasezkii]